MRKLIVILFLALASNIINAQSKFKVVADETDKWPIQYRLIDEKGRLIKKLDTAKYFECFTKDVYVYFAIFGMKGKENWVAVNAGEKIIFEVFNITDGEPSPDDLIENKIRIIDGNKKIGFANEKGNVVIKPQFEIVSSFEKGKALIGRKCEKVPWGGTHAKESDCHHYSIICQQHGYINDKGKILKIGDYTFEQIANELGWKGTDD